MMYREKLISRDVHITHELSRRADWARHDRIRFGEGDLCAAPHVEVRYTETRGI